MEEFILEELDSINLDRMLKLVHIHTGITMTENKKNLLQTRLRKRVKVLNLESYSSYMDYLESHPPEIQFFINLVTTNETSFFRTSRIWTFLQNDFLSSWHLLNPGKPIKAWSAASSTGEEAYSIAMTCQEFKIKNPTFDFQITGTDIDTDVLASAASAEFQGRSIENLKAQYSDLFKKYMRPISESKENRFRVIKELSNKVFFHRHDLFKEPSKKNYYDLIFLRNVLIYFESPDQEKVISNIYKSLSPHGLLIIGEAESLNRLKTDFQFKVPLIYEKIGR